MFRLQERTAAEGIARHQAINQARVYESDGVQDGRIAASREAVAKALAMLGEGMHTIIELGCGTCDISGHFSKENVVNGVEVNQIAIACAKERFPGIAIIEQDLETVNPIHCDVLILCETLEHVVDPVALVKKWLPMARYSVISHPIDEPMESQASGGEHCWSFNHGDFCSWFEMGGHKVLGEGRSVRVGCYDVHVATGERQ